MTPWVHTGCTLNTVLRREPYDASALSGCFVIAFCGLPGKKASDHSSGFDVVFGNRVGVPIERHRRIGVPEPCLHGFHVDAVRKKLRSLRVPK